MIPVMVWVPSKVGCYWSCGDWYIGTYWNGGTDSPGRYLFPNSGYLLTRNREEIGRYATLEEAQEAARKHNIALMEQEIAAYAGICRDWERDQYERAALEDDKDNA